MKKRLFLAVAAAMLAVPSLFAQQVSINDKGLLKKIERSDADIVNPKKSESASTWISRGEVFYETATEVSKNLYDGISIQEVAMLFGEPAGLETVTIQNRVFNKAKFPYVDIYIDAAAVPVSWVFTREIYPNALAQSVAAYQKAYALDGSNAKTATKVAAGLKKAYDEYSKIGALYYALAMYDKAADNFAKAYDVSRLPGSTIQSSDVYTLLHDAGLAQMLAGNHTQSIEYLVKAESLNTADPEIYYLIYHAYRGTANDDADAIKTAKTYLEKGMSLHPADSRIIESLSEAYVFLGEDPGTILTIVKNATENEPNNVDMWSALGVLYVSQENYTDAIGAFEHMVELTPDSYIANNNLGIVYIKLGEQIMEEVNSRAATFTDQAQYDKELMSAFTVFAQAVPYLEKASQIDPSNIGTIELLKNVTFRIRDLDGMMEKYEKYNALFKQLAQ